MFNNVFLFLDFLYSKISGYFYFCFVMNFYYKEKKRNFELDHFLSLIFYGTWNLSWYSLAPQTNVKLNYIMGKWGTVEVEQLWKAFFSDF